MSATIFAAAGAALTEPAFLDTVPIRFGLAEDGALSRAASRFALRLFDLSGKLMRQTIRYLRNGRVETIAALDPKEMLLDHLRLARGAVGHQGRLQRGRLRRLHGGARTARRRRARLRAGQCLHPVHRHDRRVRSRDGRGSRRGRARCIPSRPRMVAHHGSQCGFCTPGIVMSLFALYQEGARPVARQAVTDQLAGNLCRCTGYRPIVDAALEACAGRAAGPLRAASRGNRRSPWPCWTRRRRHSSATPNASSPRRARSRPSPTSIWSIPMRHWSPGRRMSGCGSPSSCATSPRSSGSAASPGSTSSSRRRQRAVDRRDGQPQARRGSAGGHRSRPWRA